MGDVVSLVEKAAETIEQDEAERLAAKLQKGAFDLDDFASQLAQIGKMGGMKGLLGLLPGVAKVKKQMAEGAIDDRLLARQQAIISSMTPKERRNAKILKGSRKRRVAAGSGTTVQDVNRLLKQFKDMTVMMKRVRKLGKKGLMRHGLPGMPPSGFTA
jgi:signal recognition particle subunit SRP54